MYFRFRWGTWRLDIDGETVARGLHGNALDGICSLEEWLGWAAREGVVVDVQHAVYTTPTSWDDDD